MASETIPSLSRSDERYKAMSDAELVGAIAATDKAAFAVFFGRYAGKVRGFLMKMGAAGSDADELSQEVMVTVWRKASTYDETRAQVTTWLFTIARNRWIDTVRKHARPEPDPHDPMFQPSPSPDGLTHVTAQNREARVRMAISELNESQREVLIASFFRGLSQSEIAEDLGLPIGTVKSRTRLAFARLREVLGDGLVEDLRHD